VQKSLDAVAPAKGIFAIYCFHENLHSQVDILLSAGAAKDLSDELGDTALIGAARQGQAAVVAKMLSFGATQGPGVAKFHTEKHEPTFHGKTGRLLFSTKQCKIVTFHS